MTDTRKTATFLKDAKGGESIGSRKLWRFDPPMPFTDWRDDSVTLTPLVVTSAVDHVIGRYRIHETYLFPADEDGNITDGGELNGSMKNTTDHAEAIRHAGYEVVIP